MSKDFGAHLASYVILIAAACLVGYVTYSFIYPVQVCIHKTIPLQVVNKQVRAGEILAVKFEFTKIVDCPATVYRMLKNDALIPLPVFEVYRMKGYYKFTSYATKIPHGTPSGRYILEYKFRYEVNAFRAVTDILETEPFWVVK